MSLPRRFAALSAAVLLVFPPAAIHAQQPGQTVAVFSPQYTSIVVFGDSLSDTGNDANLSGAKYGIRIPGLFANYTDGRFTDGLLTFPGTATYQGVWIEQLAAMMPGQPAVLNSLNGGADYAYGFAFTGQGTTNLILTTNPIPLSITVDNIGLQISTYLATHPAIDSHTLFVVWGGANDVLNATSATDVVNAATNEALDINALVKAGATQILVLNLPPLGETPRLNTSPTTELPYNAGSVFFNKLLTQDIGILKSFIVAKHVSIFQMDVFTLFNQVIASPASFGLTNVTTSSQGVVVDPDTYLFWDSIHPTTHGHNILATAAAQVLAAPPCTTHCPGLAEAP